MKFGTKMTGSLSIFPLVEMRGLVARSCLTDRVINTSRVEDLEVQGSGLTNFPTHRISSVKCHGYSMWFPGVMSCPQW
jgi:hypothetical protein